MKVRVLFFGATADEAGKRELEIDLPETTVADEAFALLIEEFPQLQKHSLLFALNEEYVKGEEAINEGDELAVFTAVSGG